jgi:regulator of replication initiation timing
MGFKNALFSHTHTHTQVELAAEELERAQQRVTELQLERDALSQRLAAANTRHQPASSEEAAEGGSGREPEGAGGMREGVADRRGEGFWERQVRVRSEQAAALEAQLAVSSQAVEELRAQMERKVGSG